MPIDYEKIREENIRKYGEETSRYMSSFSDRMYTDQTHFVFEILQNAEDVSATRIQFDLFDDRVEVAHNGRPFNEQDVIGICGIGEGTKTENLTQIGQFGIGFKSVYAYTATPEIHSDGESFKIEHYVRPYSIPSKEAGNSWTTLFVFPFNAKEIEPKKACKEISNCLRNMRARTLLFLRKINKIEYKLTNSIGGTYQREEEKEKRKPARQVRVIGKHNEENEDENWLIFERTVTVPEKPETVRVEVGFRLENKDKTGNEFITENKDSALVVYFPTEKETRFGFLLQGPYRTTRARDNIPKDDEWNKTLIQETAGLIRDTLPQIRDLGLLSVSFLETLPIRTDDFPDGNMFYPIVESVRNVLIEEELLPADDGSFISAKNAKLARGADLINLLSQTQMCQLFESSSAIKWLTREITQDKAHDLHSYLTSELDVEEVTARRFAEKLDDSFLCDQPDKWFINLYQYLSGQEALWRAPIGILRSKPILRLEDGSQAVPFKSEDGTTPNAFLPIPEETDFPVIQRSIATDEQSREFLQRLGLSKPNVFDYIVERVLPKYSKTDEIPVSVSEHQTDIDRIIRAMESDSESGKRRIRQKANET
ncbi:MAG: hypothetical protein OXF42_03250, partial [Candidatus Dadabacteria bacterium]|nr:hypothetical protein [Candidatus Dadabacteria bacterium]